MYASCAGLHEALTERLKRELASGTFAYAALFHGQRFSGRMSLALETCRILSCARTAVDDCRCRSCQGFDRLENTNLVVVSSRDHNLALESAFAMYAQNRTAIRLRQLVRLVRIMLLQYHGALLESGGQKSQPFDAAATVNECLIGLEQAQGNTQAKAVKELKDALKPVLAVSKRSGALTVAHVRSLQDWTAQTSVDNSRRFIILEGIEQCSEAGRNSLLKFLEEPPSDTWLFILSEQPSRIPQTILSRLRKYHVPALSGLEKDTAISMWFGESGSTYASVEDFILSKAGVDCSAVSSTAQSFLTTALGGNPIDHTSLAEWTEQMDDPVTYDYFLGRLHEKVENLFLHGRVDGEQATRIAKRIDSAAFETKTYNQNRRLALEGLFHSMHEATDR